MFLLSLKSCVLMMKTTLFGITLTALFGIAMIFAPNVVADDDLTHKDIVKSEVKVETEDGVSTLKAELETGDTIATDGSSGAFGYGFITGASEAGPENVLAITTHMCAADHFAQSSEGDCDSGTIGILTQLGLATNEDHNGPEWHAHVLDLKPIAEDSACDLNVPDHIGLEVDVGRTLEGNHPAFPEDETFPTNNVIAPYPVEVDGNEIEVKSVPTSDLYDSGVEGIVYFGIAPLTSDDDPTFITNLCLTS